MRHPTTIHKGMPTSTTSVSDAHSYIITSLSNNSTIVCLSMVKAPSSLQFLHMLVADGEEQEEGIGKG